MILNSMAKRRLNIVLKMYKAGQQPQTFVLVILAKLRKSTLVWI